MPRPVPSHIPKRRSTCTPADVFHDVVRYIENGEIHPLLAATWSGGRACRGPGSLPCQGLHRQDRHRHVRQAEGALFMKITRLRVYQKDLP